MINQKVVISRNITEAVTQVKTSLEIINDGMGNNRMRLSVNDIYKNPVIKTSIPLDSEALMLLTRNIKKSDDVLIDIYNLMEAYLKVAE